MAVPVKRRRLLVGAAIVVVILGGVGAYAARSGAPPPAAAVPTLEFEPGQLTRMESRRLSYDLVIPGTVQSLSQATVRSRLSAVVQKINVREGDAVQAGQVLVEFETAPLRAQLAERQAGLESAKANLAQAQRTREANAQLVQRNFITQNAFDAADATYQAQSAGVAAAQAQLAQTQLQLDDAIVRAPIGGVVARRYVQSGEKVGPDAQLLSIVNLAQLEVQAQAAVSDVARLRVGAPAEVQIEGLGGEPFSGRVDRINPSADPGSRAIDLYITFANERNKVRTGMFASVRLHLAGDREVATLPLGAIQLDGGQSIVWSIGQGRLTRHVVSVGRRDEQAQRIEILGGIDPGTDVLAGRIDNLKDGAPASVLAAASNSGRGSAQAAAAGAGR